VLNVTDYFFFVSSFFTRGKQNGSWFLISNCFWIHSKTMCL